MEYKRCKACGFIIAAGKLHNKCPACGAPATAFEKCMLEMSETRKKILDAHIHPVSVHFPEGIGILIAVLGILALMVSEATRLLFLNTISVLGLISPIVSLLAMVTGIYDAKVRFKRTNTPYLNKKKLLGGIIIVIDILLAVFARPSIIEANLSIVLALSLIHVILAGLLGLFGGQLICVAMRN